MGCLFRGFQKKGEVRSFFRGISKFEKKKEKRREKRRKGGKEKEKRYSENH
jgi:hypothetical protein